MSEDVSPIEKSYDGLFKNVGNQFGFSIFYPAWGNFHIGLLPAYSSYQYAYNTQYAWNGSSQYSLENQTTHQQKLRYLEIPISLRYYFGYQNFKPYLEGIVSYSLLHTANKKASTNYTQTNELYSSEIQSSVLQSDYSNSYITSKFDLGVGAGISYDFNQIILMLGASYNYNLHNIINEKERYSNNLFVGNSYDVQDDLKLHSLKINLMVIFPISKLTKRSSIECHYFNEKRRK